MSRSFWMAGVRLLLAAGLLAGFVRPALAQGRDPVADLLQTMTPEEKVGQLFLVSFYGTESGPDSQIYDLIANQHVGGVVLMAGNDNFSGVATAESARTLVAALQNIEAEAAFSPLSEETPHSYVPLLIGLSQEGGGAPNDQVLSDLTSLPNQMALGATWNPDLAKGVGEVMGRELAALGVNLYLGLSLDVLTLNNPAVNSDLNTRAFGGDPYWVGEFARAYTQGLHTGSDGRLLVIAKHFPGRGGADRPAAQEISTIRRSLDELKSVELLPFFAVMGNAPDTNSTADGVLVSHIRYQGFQGNIRATTRPISFDQQALGQVLGLPELAGWRTNGGLIVSDNLGTAAVRRFYDPDLRTFSGRLVARDAFLAGNDLLYMGNIVSSDAPDAYTTVVRSLEFFTQKYREDPAFASRVDDAVRRILVAKFKLYPDFNQPIASPASVELQGLGTSREQVFAVARGAATLISPSQADLATVLPTPPGLLDYIVFLGDARTVRQCSSCADLPQLGKTAFQMAVQRLYGPAGGGLVIPSHLSSYSFDDLNLMLENQLPTPELANDLGRASWVIISTQDLPEGSTQMAILRRFLAEKQSLLTSKKVLLFSFSAPYYLDATDISKLTAYYGLYSASEPFVDVAARILFQEISPLGALPVSVPGTGYDLILATTPNPNQVIKLNIDQPISLNPTPTGEVTTTPELPAVPSFRVGDTLSLRTGVILDHNQHPVPDGTVVRFNFSQGESGLLQQVEATTVQGLAVTAYRLDKPGLIQISAVSEPAQVSDTIQLNVTAEGVEVVIITPTLEATPSPTVTATVLAPTPTPQTQIVVKNGYPSLVGWFLILLVLFSGAGLMFWLGTQIVEPRWAVRWALLVFLGGLLAYNYLILSFPGGDAWLSDRGLPAFLQAVLTGQGVGLALGWLWRLASEGGNQAQK